MACPFLQQADVDKAKIKQFQKLKELPPMQLRQVSSIVTKTVNLAENKSNSFPSKLPKLIISHQVETRNNNCRSVENVL